MSDSAFLLCWLLALNAAGLGLLCAAGEFFGRCRR
jgi:hypothetical protein